MLHILLWRREWDSVSRSTFVICNLLIPHCHGCHRCHPCRGALPGIARQPIKVQNPLSHNRTSDPLPWQKHDSS